MKAEQKLANIFVERSINVDRLRKMVAAQLTTHPNLRCKLKVGGATDKPCVAQVPNQTKRRNNIDELSSTIQNKHKVERRRKVSVCSLPRFDRSWLIRLFREVE